MPSANTWLSTTMFSHRKIRLLPKQPEIQKVKQRLRSGHTCQQEIVCLVFNYAEKNMETPGLEAKSKYLGKFSSCFELYFDILKSRVSTPYLVLLNDPDNFCPEEETLGNCARCLIRVIPKVCSKNDIGILYREENNFKTPKWFPTLPIIMQSLHQWFKWDAQHVSHPKVIIWAN